MNIQKFFEIAKAKGIDESQLQISKNSSFSVSLFKHEIEKYEASDSQRIVACGVYKGKFGSARTEKLGPDTFEYLVEQIILSASKIEKEEEFDLFKGSEKYHKKNIYNKALSEIPAAEKVALLRELENKTYAIDERVTEVEASYEESESSSEFHNSHGLHLKEKGNSFFIGTSAVIRDGKEIKNNFDYILDSDYSKIDIDALAHKAVEGAVKKLGGESIESKKYPVVLANRVATSFIGYFLSAAIADSVQRHSSFLEGKLNTKVASSKVTIEEKPLKKNIFFSYFDDEGVATYNKPVVKKGVLATYFYNRETAKKDGVSSTGNGSWAGTKIGTSFTNVFVKPGKSSFEEMIAPIEEGVFITDIMGLGTGMNGSSGDFSCQAEGFFIKGGKIVKPVTLITLSGNLLKMFKDVKALDNETRMGFSGISCPNIYIKSMNIGGK